MNISSFLEHHSIIENPFRAEEARHDPVFTRLGLGPTTHPDFEKFVGDPHRPATSIVFGEKGSGKTAIRLQLAARITEHNLANPRAKVLLIAYDDLNPVLDRLCQAAGLSGLNPGERNRDVLRVLKQVRLSDHMDAILHLAVADLTDRLLGDVESTDGADLADEGVKSLRHAPDQVRRDMLLLQALYDRPDISAERTRRLIRLIRPPRIRRHPAMRALTWLGWIVPLVVLASILTYAAPPTGSFAERLHGALAAMREGTLSETDQTIATTLIIAAMALWGFGLAKTFIWDALSRARLARTLHRALRAAPRSRAVIAQSFAEAPGLLRDRTAMPTDGSEDSRYGLFARLRRVVERLGYLGIIVVVDRVDEPTIINGDQERMRYLIWPMLHNKFLQLDGIGIKMLLPIELRFELFRESSAFFQEARLDKQNLIERLSWSGAMLYDLCNARLNACRHAANDPISLLDLFEQTVTRQDIVDALDQMHQPRDAFKLIYQCMQEHCANVTEEDSGWRIPKLVLDAARRAQADRVQLFQRGARPA